MNKQEIIMATKTYIANTYGRTDFVLDHGEGVYLYDTEGNQYIDCLAGIAVNALGYGNKAVVDALATQAMKLIHVSNLYHTEAQVKLAKMLVDHSFAKKVFFCNSGTEAIEACLKFSRARAKKIAPDNPNKYEIVAFNGSFHGRTMGALSVTSREKYRLPFLPLLPGVKFVDFKDVEAVKSAVTKNTCAVIVEPLQGEGGVNVGSTEFLKTLRDLTTANGASLIFDEVQCGLGRTGKLFAYEHFGVTPDLMALAKPLGGGFPIGAACITDEVADVLHPGDHASTFGANPAICAAGLIVLQQLLAPGFLENVTEVGNFFRTQFKKAAEHLPTIKEVRGLGQLTGVELGLKAQDIVNEGFKHGLILGVAGDFVLRLAPPLIMKKDQATTVMGKLIPIMEGLTKK
ncbi:MAG: acetylornithine and succinylornithine aminotransferase [Promethearchaeota archaeon CR_4]|nr:MAG: acetylornithine and succinylornithine aminotransferase [Candidatus Lokiarchaeota archaeon CR_4]